MPITQWLLLKVPTLLLGILLVGGIVTIAVSGLLIVRRFIPHHKLKIHHDVADPMLGAVAAIYAVLIAFIAVIVWQNYDKADANVRLEANYMADVYRDSEAFSLEFHNKVGEALRLYRQIVVDEEWKSQARGEMSRNAEDQMNKIWALYTSYEPKTANERCFFQESVAKLNLFREFRRQRIMESRTGMHPMLWLVLIVVGFGTIMFTYLFGAEDLEAQLIMTIILSVSISMILYMIMIFDFPFTGSVSVSPEPFKAAILN